jgi:hypothetical protein
MNRWMRSASIIPKTIIQQPLRSGKRPMPRHDAVLNREESEQGGVDRQGLGEGQIVFHFINA